MTRGRHNCISTRTSSYLILYRRVYGCTCRAITHLHCLLSCATGCHQISMCSTGILFLIFTTVASRITFFIFFSMRGTFITFFFPLFLNFHSRTLQWGCFLCYWSMLQRFWAFPRTMEASNWREWRLGVCNVLLRGNVIESYFHLCSDLLG